MRWLWHGLFWPVSLLATTGCIHEIGQGVDQVGHGFSQYLQSGIENGSQWNGPVVPNDPNCGNQATGQMTLGAKKFSFDPFGGVTVIPGSVDHDRLAGSATMAPPGQKGVAFQFTGTITKPAGGQRVIQGTVTSGQCVWRVSLHRS